MAPRGSLPSDEFFPVHLAIMQPGTMAPVDLYIKAGAGSSATLYKGAHALLTEETRQRLLDRGVGELYLRKQDSDAYDEYVEENLSSIVRDDLLPRGQACQLVYEASSRVVQQFFADPRSGRNSRRAQRMVRTVVASILRDPNAMWEMTALASHDYETYTHSVNVTVLLVGASRELLRITDEAALQRIGYGGIAHDIGKSQIPAMILRKPGKLTQAEFQQIKTHPLVGLEIVGGHGAVSPEAASVIRSHHEQVDGNGYPDGIATARLEAPVRLAKIVDAYDALTSQRAYAPAHRPYDALRLMKSMEGHFDAALLESFIRFLGPGDVRSRATGPVR